MKNKKRVHELHELARIIFSVFFVVFLFTTCSFDYNEYELTEDDMLLPDLVMENVEYTRMKSAEPQARFIADRAERYEKQSIMILENITFEQYGETTEEINAAGYAGNATIETDSGNIKMENSVQIEVESEDVVIITDALEWHDEERTLSTGEEDEVTISMNTGTSFTGTGFVADARNRSWEFMGQVEGEYIFEDDEEEEEVILEEDEIIEEGQQE